MTHTHALMAAVAAGVLALGGGAAVAAPTTGPPQSSAPGPKQPIEHLALSGGLFHNTSGDPGCFGSSGSKSANFAVPRGALLTGITAYVVDSTATAGIGVTLNRHDLVTGGTYRLGNGFTTGAPGTTTLSIDLNAGALLTEPSSVNVDASIGSGTCLKGAEVHFIRNGAAVQPAESARAPETTIAAAPDGAVR